MLTLRLTLENNILYQYLSHAAKINQNILFLSGSSIDFDEPRHDNVIDIKM